LTLLVNEIHVDHDLTRGHIILAADRRITVSGRYHSRRKKLFPIPYLRAGIGYFGLANCNRLDFFSSWLPNFIRRANSASSMNEFSDMLLEALNLDVDRRILRANPSGFHVCGYNDSNLPELHFVTNIGNMRGHVYSNFRSSYTHSEDFLRRDARALGWDGINTRIPSSNIQYYINGDVRPFHAVWRQLDSFFSVMMSQGDFRERRFPESVRNRADWKLRAISSFYKRYAREVTIGPPVDTLVYVPAS
jgi:hypothetical protein